LAWDFNTPLTWSCALSLQSRTMYPFLPQQRQVTLGLYLDLGFAVNFLLFWFVLLFLCSLDDLPKLWQKN
jgi:hypothetical protein